MQTVLKNENTVHKADKKIVRLFRLEHENAKHIKLFFNYDPEMVLNVKKISGVKWNNDLKCWHIPDSVENVKNIYQTLKPNIYVDGSKFFGFRKPKPEYQLLVDYTKTLADKEIEPKLVEVYTEEFEKFVNYFKDTDIAYLSTTQQNEYLAYLKKELLYKDADLKQAKAALIFYYKNVFNPDKKFLNLEQITHLISTTENTKHRLILSLLFCTGLDRFELSNLSIFDFDVKQKTLSYQNNNTVKEFTLPNTVNSLMIKYLADFNPEQWLFEGLEKGQFKANSIDLMLYKKVLALYPDKLVGTESLNLTLKKELKDHLDTSLIETFFSGSGKLSKDQKAKIINLIEEKF